MHNTKQISSEKELDFSNRTLILFNVINAALRHEKSEQALLDVVCMAISRYGNYQLVWLGYAENHNKPVLRPVTYTGAHDVSVDSLIISLEDDYYAPGSPGYTMRSKKKSLRNSNEDEAVCDSWCLIMRQLGYSSSIALPVMVADEIIGTLCICTEKKDAFDAIEVQMLSTMASNLSYGIESLRSRLENEHKTQQLTVSENRLHTIINNVSDGILVLDMQESVVFVNPAAQQIFGRPQDLLVGKPFGFPIETGETTLINLLQQDGQPVKVEMHVADTVWNDQPAYVLSLHDITQRLRAVEEAKQQAEMLHTTLVGTIKMIAMALEKRDPYTSGHQKRVAELARAIAIEMGLDEDRVEGIYLGGMIHDIGKIHIPAEILNRPGKLKFYEFAIIKTHPQVGYEIVRDIKFPWPIADIVHQHHERLDGSGYPAGLKGEEISLEARILTIADVVEAISAHRPYRPALDIQVGLDEIRDKRGIWYEPVAVDACLRLFQQNNFLWSI